MSGTKLRTGQTGLGWTYDQAAAAYDAPDEENVVGAALRLQALLKRLDPGTHVALTPEQRRRMVALMDDTYAWLLRLGLPTIPDHWR